MRNTKIFKTFINFFDRSKGLSPAPSVCTSLIIIPKLTKPSNLFLNSNNKLNFETKFNIVKNFINTFGVFNLNFKEFKFKFKPTIIKNISGLFCPAPKEQRLLSVNNDEFNFKKTLSLNIMDYCFKLYGKQITSMADLIRGIENLLKFSNFEKSPYSYPANHKCNLYFYFGFKQHLLASDFAGKEIPFKFLVDYFHQKDYFDFNEYLNKTCSPTIVFEFGLFNLSDDALPNNINLSKGLRVLIAYAINPDKAFLNGVLKNLFFAVVAQPNPDIVFFYIKYDTKLKFNNKISLLIENIKAIPRDMKFKANPEKTLSLFKSHISISFNLDYESLFKRFLGDLKGASSQKYRLELITKDERDLAQEWARELESLIKSKATLEEKKLKFNFIQNRYLLNEKIKILLPSKIVDAIEDIDFSVYYNKHTTQINILIEKVYQKVDNRLFNGQSVDQDYVEELLLEILDAWKVFDPVLAKTLLDNYLSAKKLFILHDVGI